MNRGKQRKTRPEEPSTIAEFIEVSHCAAKRAWARLIKQVAEVDPLVCPRCAGPMRIIAFIEQPALNEKILIHLGLCAALSWSKGTASAHSPPAGYPLRYSLQRVALAA
ncbi:MAG: hypothetical protein WCI75_12725 [candidate division NC10 bacterium]